MNFGFRFVYHNSNFKIYFVDNKKKIIIIFSMKENIIKTKTYNFALKIIELYKTLHNKNQ